MSSEQEIVSEGNITRRRMLLLTGTVAASPLLSGCGKTKALESDSGSKELDGFAVRNVELSQSGETFDGSGRILTFTLINRHNRPTKPTFRFKFKREGITQETVTVEPGFVPKAGEKECYFEWHTSESYQVGKITGYSAKLLDVEFGNSTQTEGDK